MYHDHCSTKRGMKRGMICCNIVRHRKMENMSGMCIVSQPGGVGHYGACHVQVPSGLIGLFYFIFKNPQECQL